MPGMNKAISHLIGSAIALAFFCIQASAQTQPPSAPINSLCAENSITSFKTEGLLSFKDEKIDYCTADRAAMPPQIANTITRLSTG